MSYIRRVEENDLEKLNEIVKGVGNFTQEEVACAIELIKIAIEDGEDGYKAYCYVDNDSEVSGYVCFGATPLTEGTWDLYWIAVDKKKHNKGIGHHLIKFTENFIKSKNGRLIIVETSSKDNYESTRIFYLKLGYNEVGRIKDFYRKGDDKIIFAKFI